MRESLIQTLANNIPHTSVALLDRDLKVVLAGGDHTFRHHGFTAAQMIGRCVLDFVDDPSHEQVRRMYASTFETGATNRAERHRDGKVYDITVLPIFGDGGVVEMVLSVSQDVTARADQIVELTAVALRDEMTGLYNRRGFMTLAPNRIEVACRANEGVLLGFADMDGLKAINDAHGHAVGDAAIVTLARLLTRACRAADLVARLGGDEFVFLAIGLGADKAIRMRVALEIGAVNDMEGAPFRLGVTVAFSALLLGENLADLIDRADREMYARKRRKASPRY